ncbi:MAG: GNAT family N-acetyltransferase [Tepidisphaeraceae bacterium]
MIFQTDRLIVRRYTCDDAAQALRIYGDPEVMQFLGDGKTPVVSTIDEMRNRLVKRIEAYERAPGFGGWATVLKSTNELIGTTLLKDLDGGPEIEVGWHFARSVWSNGYATEAARGAVKYGFESKNLPRIVAVVHAANSRSLAVVRRLGMAHEGVRHFYNVDLEYFALARSG